MSAASPIAIRVSTARRFARAALHLDRPFPEVLAALKHLGYVQIDPINVCGRMHDLILRARVEGYREGDLMRCLHGPPDAPLAPSARIAFEQHVPDTSILVAFPLEAWPHLQAAMQRRARGVGRWAGRLTPREKILAAELLTEIARRGPLASEDFDDDRKALPVWGAAKLVKATLQKLFFHGRLLIAHRVNHRRRYDLPERVLPAAVLQQPQPSAAETDRWLARLKLRQRRLAPLKKNESAHLADLVQRVTLTDLPSGVACPPLYCLKEDVPLLAALAANEDLDARGEIPAAPPLRLLAPLDPLIYDRRVTSALWNFDYTWEVYTPPAKRIRGYYALPVLAGHELVGHVDPKADRAAGRLLIQSQQTRRGHPLRPAVTELAHWLGLKP